jgi:guanylate kinase
MSHAREFDFVIVNDDLQAAVAELEAVLQGDGDANRSDSPELQHKMQKILA